MENCYTVLDLFAGAGGFGLGFKFAGYSIEYALEMDSWAALTYQTNHPNTIVIEEDIKTLQTDDDIKTVVNFSEFDIIIGGPPCQGFSVAGPKKDPKDPRNSLFIDFARWVKVLKPKVFIIENVSGILSRRNIQGEKVTDIIESTFNEIGYSTEIWRLNAAEYGVPQIRNRVFIVGNLNQDIIAPPKKTHNLAIQVDQHDLLDAVTVEQAIGDLPIIHAGEGRPEMDFSGPPKSEYQQWARGEQKKLFNHEAMKHTKRIIERFKQIECGKSAVDVPEKFSAKKRNGNGETSKINYHMNNRRLDPTKPSYTIPASFYSSFVHPYQHRNITAREAARLQGFPDYYKFMGKRTVISSKLLQKQERLEDNHLSQYNQIGNAVPPLLAKAIAEHIKDYLLSKEKSPVD